MFKHIYITRLKCLLRDKEMIFWSLLFPIVLALLFNVAFSGLNESESFDPVSVAVVRDSAYEADSAFRESLRSASAGADKLFDLEEVSLSEAKSLLLAKEISGYILAGPSPTLVASGTGFGPSLAKMFLDNYSQTASAVTSILARDPSAWPSLTASLDTRLEYTEEVSPGGGEPNNVVNYFYSLVAMACMYGAFFGNREIMDIQANLSALAARVSVSPVHKLKSFLSSILASITLSSIEILLLLAFLAKVIGIDFGSDTGLVILTALAGSFTGVSFGAFVSSLVKKDEGVKIGVIISVSMFGSFLAGMMYEDMKYIVQQNAPLLSYLNPVNLLTDAFYSLYYYDSYSRYALNMGILSIFSAVFCVGTYLVVRRRKYASI